MRNGRKALLSLIVGTLLAFGIAFLGAGLVAVLGGSWTFQVAVFVALMGLGMLRAYGGFIRHSTGRW